MNNQKFEAIDIKSWQNTPAINNKIATENDVKRGIATFYVTLDSPEHTPVNINLPKLAYLPDSESTKECLVVVIQLEKMPKDTLVGYRELAGGYGGVCTLQEIRLLSEDEISALLNK